MIRRAAEIPQKLVEFSLRRPRLVLASTFAVLLTSLVLIPSLELNLDLYDGRNKNFESSLDWAHLKETFQDHNSLTFVFKSQLLNQPESVCRWHRVLESQEHSIFNVKRVADPFLIRHPKSENEVLYFPSLNENPCTNPTTLKQALNKLEPTLWKDFFYTPKAQHWVTEFIITDDHEKLPFESLKALITNLTYEAHHLDPNSRLDFLGPLSFRYFFRTILARDSIFNFALLLFLVICFRLLFGTWSSGLWYVLTVFVSWLTLAGFMSLFKFPIDSLGNNLFLLTAIAGTSDFIFISYRQLSNDYKDSFQRLALPCAMTSFTTFAGFISLASSDFSNIAHFGICAAVASVIQWLATFMVLPSVRSQLGHSGPWVKSKSGVLCYARVKELIDLNAPKWLCIGVLLFCLLSPFYATRLSINDTPAENFPKGHPLRSSIETFKQEFGWEGFVYLVFDREVDTETARVYTDKIRQHPFVKNVTDFKSISEEWTKDEAELRKEAIERTLKMSPLGKKYLSSDRITRATVLLKDMEVKNLKEFKQFTNQICENQCRLVGQSIVYLDFNERTSTAIMDGLATSLLLVVLVIFLYGKMIGAKTASLTTVLSILIGPGFMLTFMGLFEIPVNVITSIFLSTLVGITGDNAIHFITFSQKDSKIRSGIAEQGVPGFLSAIVLIVGSCFFFFQTLVPIKILGLLFTVGFIASVFGDIWILKYLTQEKDKKPLE